MLSSELLDNESASGSQRSSSESSHWKKSTGNHLANRKAKNKQPFGGIASSLLVYNSVRQLAVPVMRPSAQRPAEKKPPLLATVSEQRSDRPLLQQSLCSNNNCNNPHLQVQQTIQLKAKLKVSQDYQNEVSEISCDQSIYI